MIGLKNSMECILEYVEYPLPAICFQAVKVTSWFYLFSAALAAQNWCQDGANNNSLQLVNEPLETSEANETVLKYVFDGEVFQLMNVTVINEIAKTSACQGYWWFFQVFIRPIIYYNCPQIMSVKIQTYSY